MINLVRFTGGGSSSVPVLVPETAAEVKPTMFAQVWMAA